MLLNSAFQGHIPSETPEFISCMPDLNSVDYKLWKATLQQGNNQKSVGDVSKLKQRLIEMWHTGMDME